MSTDTQIPKTEKKEDKCCSMEDKIDFGSQPSNGSDEEPKSDGRTQASSKLAWKAYIPAIISFVFLVTGLAAEHIFELEFFEGWLKILWYTAAYFPVGLPVMKEAWEALRKGEVFTEFFLMSIATIGAFAIGEYPEGVAVMLFYAIGELFQSAAVKRAKGNIKALLDVRPKIHLRQVGP